MRCILLTGFGEQTQKLSSDASGSQKSLPVTQVENTAPKPPGTDNPPQTLRTKEGRNIWKH